MSLGPSKGVFQVEGHLHIGNLPSQTVVGEYQSHLGMIRYISGELAQIMALDSSRMVAGVDRSYLGGMERGEKNPTVDVLDKFAGTLSVSVAELFSMLPQGNEATAGLRRGRKPRVAD